MNEPIGIAKRDIAKDEIIEITIDAFGRLQSEAIEFNEEAFSLLLAETEK